MSVHQYKNGSYYVKYWVPELKKHRSKAFGKGDENSPAYHQAVAFHEEINALKKLGKSLVTINTSTTILLEDVANDFFIELKSNNQVKQYHRDWRNILKTVVLPELGGIPVEEITAHDIRKLKIAFQNRGNKPATINRYMGYLNQIFNHGIRYEIIEKNPMRFWRKTKEEKLEFKLTIEDAQKIYDVAPDHLQWAITVATKLIARFGAAELFNIKWGDIDWKHKEICYYMPKVKEYKTVQLADEFIEKLKERQLIARTDYLVEYRGKPIRSIKTAWKNAVHKAELSYFPRPYDLRHLTITELINKGIPISVVSKLAGHKDIKTTLNVYTHSNSSLERDAITQLPSFAA